MTNRIGISHLASMTAVVSAVLTFSSFSNAGIKVMVLDTPIDYQHSWLTPFVDTTAMSRYSFRDTDNRVGSWKDLNDFYMSDLKMSLNRDILPELLKLLDVRRDRKLSPEQRQAAEDELIRNVRSNTEWKQALTLIGNYLHGTHVAGLTTLAHEPTQLQLVTAPVFSKQGFEAFSVSGGLLQVFAPLNSRAKQNIDELTRAIEEQQIKVVNMSFGSTWMESIESTMRSEIPLFQQNPETVFVIAAGNSGTDLSAFLSANREMFPESKIKNVLFVGALDEKGDLASFSDYGVGVVPIAAPGTLIGSACPDNKIMHMDGTSMAAPIVSNRVALVRLQHPELSAQEAIQYLLDHETVSMDHLTGRITEGRALRMNTEIQALQLFDDQAMQEFLRFIEQ